MAKKVTGPLHLADAEPTNADFSSIVIPATGIDVATMVIETAGVTAATGEFKVMARNGRSAWSSLAISPSIILANANINTNVVLSNLSFTELRIDFIRGSSGDDGTFSIWFQGEGLI